jgi:hypothetical protein
MHSALYPGLDGWVQTGSQQIPQDDGGLAGRAVCDGQRPNRKPNLENGIHYLILAQAQGTAKPSFTASLIERNANPSMEQELIFKWASASFYGGKESPDLV